MNTLEQFKDLNVLADYRWCGMHGIGRFATEVLKRIPRVTPLQTKTPMLHPLDPLILSGQLRRVPQDVYFSPGFNPPLWSSIPFSFVLHDLVHLNFPQYRTWKTSLFYNGLVRSTLKKAGAVMTVSQFSKMQLLEWGKLKEEQVVVVGNGVSPDFQPLGATYNPGYPYFLYVGNQKPHKNVPGLLTGFARSGVADQVRLVMTGHPSRNLEELMRALGIHDKVHFLGPIPEDELPNVYRGAVALLYPAFYEGFGLPAAEAMASGLPVLTSRNTAVEEVTAGNAVLVDPRQPESIAEGIKQIVGNTEIRTSLRLQGLEIAKRYRWDNVAEAVLDTLAGVVAQRYR